MKHSDILYELFKYQPSKDKLVTVLYDMVDIHVKGRETSVFPRRMTKYNLAFWLTRIGYVAIYPVSVGMSLK